MHAYMTQGMIKSSRQLVGWGRS